MKLKLLISMSFMVLLSACTSISSKMTAAPNINPDINNTPSPVAISIFELTDAQNFQRADFFALYNNAKASLGNTLLYEKNIVMPPNQSLAVSVPYVKGAHFIGYIAAFRNLHNVTWRALISINPQPVLGQDVQVRIDNNGIHAQVIVKAGNPL